LWALLFEDAHPFEDTIWGDELCSATTVNLKRIPQVWSQELQKNDRKRRPVTYNTTGQFNE